MKRKISAQQKASLLQHLRINNRKEELIERKDEIFNCISNDLKIYNEKKHERLLHETILLSQLITEHYYDILTPKIARNLYYSYKDLLQHEDYEKYYNAIINTIHQILLHNNEISTKSLCEVLCSNITIYKHNDTFITLLTYIIQYHKINEDVSMRFYIKLFNNLNDYYFICQEYIVESFYIYILNYYEIRNEVCNKNIIEKLFELLQNSKRFYCQKNILLTLLQLCNQNDPMFMTIMTSSSENLNCLFTLLKSYDINNELREITMNLLYTYLYQLYHLENSEYYFNNFDYWINIILKKFYQVCKFHNNTQFTNIAFQLVQLYLLYANEIYDNNELIVLYILSEKSKQFDPEAMLLICNSLTYLIQIFKNTVEFNNNQFIKSELVKFEYYLSTIPEMYYNDTITFLMQEITNIKTEMNNKKFRVTRHEFENNNIQAIVHDMIEYLEL